MDSPRAPWKRERGSGHAFPAYNQVPMREAPGPAWNRDAPVAPPEPAGELQVLQRVLTAARRAEVRVKKVAQEKDHLSIKWERFAEELKASYVKEKQRFLKDLDRNAKEMQDALTAQESARAAVRRSWEQVALGEEPVKPEAKSTSADQEWTAMQREWEAERAADLDGVLQRAMGAPPPSGLTPPHPRMRHPRSPTEAPKETTEPSAETADVDMADAPPNFGSATATSVTPKASPRHPGQRAPGPRTPTSTAPPRSGIKDATKEAPEKAASGLSLGEKLEQKRIAMQNPEHAGSHGFTELNDAQVETPAASAPTHQAMRPFGGRTRASGAPTALINDDPDPDLDHPKGADGGHLTSME